MARTTVTEAVTLTTEAGGDTTSGRLPIRLITPGWGSSGYYSPKVLENAATAKVFPKGTQMFLDHPTETERADRPERSVRDLTAVLAEDAVWDGQGLVAEADVFGPYRPLFTDDKFIGAIGVSIAAYCERTVGEAEGRRGPIITELTEAISVDFVTKAGRGGQILAVLESARADAHEATADDARDRLERVLREVYPDDADGYTNVWVVDFDPEESVVYFRNREGLFSQGYTLTPDSATLGDDLAEVRQVVTYIPVTTNSTTVETDKPPVAPAGSTPTHESQEDTMPQIEESRLAQLEADAGRVQTLESERDTAQAERDTAREALRTEQARRIVAESDGDFTPLEVRGLVAELPVTESGQLDVEAFTTTVEEAVAERAETQGAGTIRGFGPPKTPTATEVKVSDADLDSTLGIARKGA